MNSIQNIHQKALEVAGRFKRAEADLISILQEVDAARVFTKLGFTSLFTYCVQALGLSESVTANFIAVARKAREIPVLQSAIQSGELTVSKARKITPVLTVANQEEWVEKAKALPTRKLEEEVARVAPRQAVPERMKIVSEDRVELRLGISKSARERLKRVQDLESQRTSHPVSLEEALEAMLEVYLEVKDPIRRAERVTRKKTRSRVTGHVGPKKSESQESVRASERHLIHLRDHGQCTHTNERGERCENRRWIDIHHIRPRCLGGANTAENLVTLCSAHHRLEHETGGL